MTSKTSNRLYLPDIIGGGYGTFWRFRGRYRVAKGSRASKKSKTTALWYITKMMEFPAANLLVVRKAYATLQNSCYKELKWAVHRLEVDHLWDFKLAPLEATYRPTGQKIYFRGLDDPLKTTSITVDRGVLCWCWIEEAYEIMREPDFDMVDESIRGAVPKGLFKQVTLTLNPWNERHWIKSRFFEVEQEDGTRRSVDSRHDDEVLAVTTNYLCNEWLDDADLRLFERMKANNPRRYQVAGLGHWGIVDGLVYENWEERAFTPLPRKAYDRLPDGERPDNPVFTDNLAAVFGLDFGYTNDPTALFAGFLDLKGKTLYVWDELYEQGLSNKDISERITAKGYRKEHIVADSAEPKSIDELRSLGLRVEAAKKGKDSVNNGIQWIQDLKIVVHPRCPSFLTEISNYSWAKDRFGKALNVPVDDFNHLMDAMRYGLEKHITGSKWLY